MKDNKEHGLDAIMEFGLICGFMFTPSTYGMFGVFMFCITGLWICLGLDI